MTGGWKGNPEKWADLKSTSSFIRQWDLLAGYRAKVRLESKAAPGFALTQWEIGDATNCVGQQRKNPGLENMKQSSCFGHVKGKHPRGDWVGTWINELAGDRRGWLEIQSWGIIGMGWYAELQN